MEQDMGSRKNVLKNAMKLGISNLMGGQFNQPRVDFDLLLDYDDLISPIHIIR